MDDSMAMTDGSETSGKFFLQNAECVGHILMFTLLVSLIMLFIKNYMVTTTGSYVSYSFFWAFGLPMVIVSLCTGELIYEKYVYKFKNSHPALYSRSLPTLVILTISAIVFFILVSLYMSEPSSL